jgi:hypothetical protein
MKDGKAGYILFTPQESLAIAVKKEAVQVMIEYDLGYMRVGMGEVYTVRMFTNEFCGLTNNSWELYPKVGHRRLIDGTIVHEVTQDYEEWRNIIALDSMIAPPPKILEERGRGTEIHSLADQAKLLQYRAWAQQEIEVGVMVPETKHVIEYCGSKD